MGGAGKYQPILDTFTHYIAERGYDGVNFGLVANELGVSKGTIVHHFVTKDRILATILESYMTRRLAEQQYILKTLDDPAEQLAATLHAFMLYHVEDREATVTFAREVVRLVNEESMARGASLREEYFENVCGIIDAGQRSGVFRSVDTRVDTLLLFGSAQWAWTWYRPDGDLPIQAVGQAFVDLALNGLLVDRGRVAELSDPQGAAASAVLAAMDYVAEEMAK